MATSKPLDLQKFKCPDYHENIMSKIFTLIEGFARMSIMIRIKLLSLLRASILSLRAIIHSFVNYVLATELLKFIIE